MSIQTELTRITNAKAAIKTAIEGKGVTVPDGTLLDGMAGLIESISAGLSNIEVVSFTPIETGNHMVYLETNAEPFVIFCVRDSFVYNATDSHRTDANEVPIAFCLVGKYNPNASGTSKGKQTIFHVYNKSSSSFSAGSALSSYDINKSIAADSSSVCVIRSNTEHPIVCVYVNSEGSKGLRIGETYTILCMYRS